MRGRSRDVRRAVGAEPHQVVADRLAGPGQHERSAAEDRPEKNLEAAIPPDVVERAPDDVVALRQRRADRRGQAGETVVEHLRRARRAGREKDPLCWNLELRMWNLECRRSDEIAIRHDGIHASLLGDGRKMFGRQVGRAHDQPARDAVELDECERRSELIASGNQHRSSCELHRAVTDARAVEKVAETDAGRGTPEEAPPAGWRVTQAVSNRRHGTGRRGHRT